MNYPLENLGPQRFQQICQSLVAKTFPRAQCYPVDQPDGGRDITSSETVDTGVPTVIYQVKYTKTALKDRQPYKSIVDQLRTELPLKASSINAESTNYVLITNVPGTANGGSGSIAVVQKLLCQHLRVPAQCWWRDDIERRLDDAWDIKWAFPEVLRNQDIFRIVVEQHLTEDVKRRAYALRAAIEDQFHYDTEVTFQQVDLQNELLDLFIDVPVDIRNHRRGIHALKGHHRILGEIALHHGLMRRRGDPQIGAATLLLDPLGQEKLPQLVIEGAPGQGKSTIAQYVCQIHRKRILGEGTADSRIPEEHDNSPIRLPFKVLCRDFAVWIVGNNPFVADGQSDSTAPQQRTIETFLCAQIKYHSGGAEFQVSDLHSTAAVFPILVLFDGLDEVADIRTRAKVVDEIGRGVRRLQSLSLSLQAIVTSRPAAFPNSPGLRPDEFVHLQLLPIDREAITEYSEKWIRARKLKPQAASDVKRIMGEKLDEPHLRDLAGNPMQLSILINLIQRKGPSLPDKRTALYDRYMEVFFDRETDKSDIVREQRDLLLEIHGYLAWVLHSEAQTEKSGGRIESWRLRDVVRKYLEEFGHSSDLVDRLFSGVVERVVALVARLEGSYEFEVQPLREYFAARYLYDTVPYSTADAPRKGSLPERFEVLAEDGFWQNVARFFAGCYSRGELPSLMQSLRVLGSRKRFARTRYVQSLAINLLSDYTLAQYPLVVEDVVDYLLMHSDLRTVVVAQQNLRGGYSLYLPENNGREELVRECFAAAVKENEGEYVNLLMDVIAANTAVDERVDKWWRGFTSIESAGARTRWIAHGLRLGVVQREKPERVRALIGEDEGEYQERLLELAVGGMSDFVARDASYFGTSVDGVLDGCGELPVYRDASPIQSLALSVSSHAYSLAFEERSGDSLAAASRRYFGYWGIDELQWPEHGVGEVWPKVGELVGRSRRLRDSIPTSGWATSLEPWIELTECGRDLFGDRWAFYVLASSGAGILSSGERCEEARDLHDGDVSVVRRARHARMRAGQWRWWFEQIVGAQEQMEIAFVLLLCICWAGRSVVVRLRA